MSERNRARGCLVGQIAGDSLGSLVEFSSPQSIRRKYPLGMKNLEHGGVWGTLPGQPTDDSEMALILARILAEMQEYKPECVFEGYKYWLDSGPFDTGGTIRAALRGEPRMDSQANGALMRVSPIGIFAAGKSIELAGKLAVMDAHLTHPNNVCLECNALYTMAISLLIRGAGPEEVYQAMLELAEGLGVDATVMAALVYAKKQKPGDFMHLKGWVLIAFQNAVYQLLNAPSLAKGIIDTVESGGDTDTTGAIAGALLGAYHGIDEVPAQWLESILTCVPKAGRRCVMQPRPSVFWPTDVIELADSLFGQ